MRAVRVERACGAGDFHGRSRLVTLVGLTRDVAAQAARTIRSGSVVPGHSTEAPEPRSRAGPLRSLTAQVPVKRTSTVQVPRSARGVKRRQLLESHGAGA